MHSCGGLERLESLFHFADKLQKLGGIGDRRLPAEVALDEVVGFLNARARNDIADGIAIAAHEPQVVGHGGGGGDVVSDDDDGVEFVEAGDFVDEFADFGFHDQVEAGEGFVHQQKMFAAKKLLSDGDALALAAGNLRGIKLRAIEHVQALEVLQNFFVGGVGVFFDLLGGKDQVAEDGAIFEERIILGDDADHAGFDGSEHRTYQDLSGGRLIQAGDDAKELGLADARGAEKADDLTLGAIGAHDIANFRVDVAKDDFVAVGEADVINLEKRIAVFASIGQALSS